MGLVFILGTALPPAYAGAMGAASPRCHVEDAGNLPVGSVPETICGEIERAVGSASPHARYKVSVRVHSPSRLSAVAVVNGRVLPEQNFAVMDRNLDPGSVRRFAEALALEIAKAAKE